MREEGRNLAAHCRDHGWASSSYAFEFRPPGGEAPGAVTVSIIAPPCSRHIRAFAVARLAQRSPNSVSPDFSKTFASRKALSTSARKVTPRALVAARTLTRAAGVTITHSWTSAVASVFPGELSKEGDLRDVNCTSGKYALEIYVILLDVSSCA
ncbi:hypothetical protein [Dankookia sp. P2]|uniref:hypothetical protein n=1 Tax=Dankookia sp. P2 TaxID=3423955 RepID=UPI003D66B090